MTVMEQIYTVIVKTCAKSAMKVGIQPSDEFFGRFERCIIFIRLLYKTVLNAEEKSTSDVIIQSNGFRWFIPVVMWIAKRENNWDSRSKRTEAVLYILYTEKLIQYGKYEPLMYLYSRAERRDGSERSAFRYWFGNWNDKGGFPDK